MNILKKSNYPYQEIAFDSFIIITYLLIFLYILGVSPTAKSHLDIIDKYVRIYICLFLIYRFNPLRKNYDFTTLDRKIVFSAGSFMFATTFFGIAFF